jgi:DUF4097 and DUF4098 domain-containing protein YvlB
MRPLILTIFLGVLSAAALAEGRAEFERVISLAPADHIVLDVAVGKGDVTISYSHAGEIKVTATAKATDEKDVPANFFDTALTVQREGDHVKVQSVAKAVSQRKDLKVVYTIYVPNWIEVNSTVEDGKQSVSGVMGPVKLVSGSGDIKVNYITKTLDAKTGGGNITVIRVGSAAKVETAAGNINLKDIGPASVATVKKGTGRIEMDGVSGSFTGSTDAGELDASGGVFGDWDLKSTSGNIRIGLGPESKFDFDAATGSGKLSIENDDIEQGHDCNVHTCRQKVNGGGKVVRARSASGAILIK